MTFEKYFFTGVIILIVLGASMFFLMYATHQYFPEGYTMYAEHYKNLKEVQLFYEKYPNDLTTQVSMSETVSYHAINEDWSADVELEIFHGRHNFDIEKMRITCVNENVRYQTEDVLDYLQNNDCFNN